MNLLTQPLTTSLHLPHPSNLQPQPHHTLSFKSSRRDLTVGLSSLPILSTYFHSEKARADTKQKATLTSCSTKPTTKQAFFEVSVDGQPIGHVVVGLYGDDAPVGINRFASLVSGTAGISFRRKGFVKDAHT